MPALTDEIPADVLAVLDFPVPTGAFELVQKLPAPLIEAARDERRSACRTSSTRCYTARPRVYVRAALPMPEVTLVTQPADTAAASSTLDDLLARAADDEHAEGRRRSIAP